MKTLLNQVIAAQKEAEANLIKRREETAAARSQANTAKLLAENPHLPRLKELELLKDVLAGTNGDVRASARATSPTRSAAWSRRTRRERGRHVHASGGAPVRARRGQTLL